MWREGLRGCEGGDCGGKCWWRKAMEARRYCWVMHSGQSHHHSLTLSRRQHQQLNSRAAGPPRAWYTELQNRTPATGGRARGPCVPGVLSNRGGPQAREPSKCLNRRGYRERPAKRPSDCQLHETWEKTLIGPQLLQQRQCPCTRGATRVRTSHAAGPPSRWGRAATGKSSLTSVQAGPLQSCPTLCGPLDFGLPGFSVRESGSPGKNTGAFWPILVAIPF